MLTAGELVDRKYRLLKRLGSGALGEVWAARNETVEREVAIKFLVPSWSIAPRSLEAFFREAKSSGKIRHPSVVQFLDIGEIEDERKIPFVVMELLECEKLESLLAREKHLPVGTALRMISELAWALVAGHDRSLIHERIEPANVLLHRDLKGEIVPKLVDFGIARLVDDLGPLSVTGSAHEALSPLAYLSPEQIHGDVELDGRADVYALGVLLHRVLVGRVPFEASDPEVLLEQVEQGSPYLEAFEPPLDAKVMNLVSDCLQRNRRLRPTMRVLAERADALLERIDPQWKRFGTLVSIPEDRTARKLEAMRPSSRPPRSHELPAGKKQSAPRIPAAPIVPNVAVPIPKPSIGAPIGGRVTSAKPAAAKSTLMGVAPHREGQAHANPRIETLPMKPIPDPRLPIGAPLRAPSDPAKISRPTVKVTPAQPALGQKGTVDPPTLKIENNPFAAKPAVIDHGHHHPPPVPHRLMTPPLPRGAPKAAAQSVPPPPLAQRAAPSHGLASAPLVDDDEAPISSGALEEVAPDSAIPISGHDVEEVDEDMAATQQRKPPLPRAAPPPSMDETGDELAPISHLIAERLSGTGHAAEASSGLQLDVLHDLESELLKRVAVSRASLPDVTEAAVLEKDAKDEGVPPMEGLFGSNSSAPPAPLLVGADTFDSKRPAEKAKAKPQDSKAPSAKPKPAAPLRSEKPTIAAVATTPRTDPPRRNNGPAIAFALVAAAIAIVLVLRMKPAPTTASPASSASATTVATPAPTPAPTPTSTQKVEEVPTIVASSAPSVSAPASTTATTVAAATTAAPPTTTPNPVVTTPPPPTTTTAAPTVAVKPPDPVPSVTAPKPKPKASGDPYYGVESAGF
ncbi:MAG: protein kinase [Myxococcales bacterium]|nr:protein kinase [Myxococcales bacterium]